MPTISEVYEYILSNPGLIALYVLFVLNVYVWECVYNSAKDWKATRAYAKGNAK